VKFQFIWSVHDDASPKCKKRTRPTWQNMQLIIGWWPNFPVRWKRHTDTHTILKHTRRDRYQTQAATVVAGQAAAADDNLSHTGKKGDRRPAGRRIAYHQSRAQGRASRASVSLLFYLPAQVARSLARPCCARAENQPNRLISST
jgi:hypothetical protein